MRGEWILSMGHLFLTRVFSGEWSSIRPGGTVQMRPATVLLYLLPAIATAGITSPQEPAVCGELARLATTSAGLTAYLDSRASGPENACTGVALSLRAARLAVAGNNVAAKRDAQRSIAILEKTYSRDDRILIRPLHTLAVAQFELGKRGEARKIWRKLQAMPVTRSEDRDLVHSLSVRLFNAGGQFKEAESEYKAVLSNMEESGRGDSADAGTVLNALASVYINEGQIDDAKRAIDRALGILNRAKDAKDALDTMLAPAATATY